MCHALSRREEWRETLGECLGGKCIMLQDYHIGLQHMPTTIVNNYDMKVIKSTKDSILKFLQTFRNTILCQLQTQSLTNVGRSSR